MDIFHALLYKLCYTNFLTIPNIKKEMNRCYKKIKEGTGTLDDFRKIYKIFLEKIYPPAMKLSELLKKISLDLNDQIDELKLLSTIMNDISNIERELGKLR